VEELGRKSRGAAWTGIPGVKLSAAYSTDLGALALVDCLAVLAQLPDETFDLVITSPPYPGLIDYHEQHRYSYELLGLQDRRADEIGPASRGQSRQAVRAYVEDMIAVFANAHQQLAAGAPVIIVVNDSKELYPEILEQSGLRLEERLTRHVNRRTGRRAGEFFEDVLVCVTA